MYAKLKDGQLEGMIDGSWLGNIANPTSNQLAEAGYYAVPAIPAGKVATAWSLTDGALVPTLADAPKVPRVFSKMKLVAALMALGYWEKVKAYIEAQGLTDLYLAAQVVTEDNSYFKQSLSALKAELGVTDAQAEEVLSQCVAE